MLFMSVIQYAYHGGIHQFLDILPHLPIPEHIAKPTSFLNANHKKAPSDFPVVANPRCKFSSC